MSGNDAYTKDIFSRSNFTYPRYSRLDYGLMAGANLAFRAGQKTTINAELYYYQGLKEQSGIIIFLQKSSTVKPLNDSSTRACK